MTTAARQFRVAAAQIEAGAFRFPVASPRVPMLTKGLLALAVFYDAQANLARILATIEEAAAGGARLVVFSGSLGGPFSWAFSHLTSKLLQNSH